MNSKCFCRPKKLNDMIEKILLSEAEKQMEEVSSISKLRGINDSKSVVISPNNLPYPNTGGDFKEGNLFEGRWYRIATGGDGGGASSGLFNIGSHYGKISSMNILFYAFAEGYGNKSTVAKIASSLPMLISKVRLLYGKSGVNSLLDIYISASSNNNFSISAAALIRFKLNDPKEVSEEIPEGYSVKEFTF